MDTTNTPTIQTGATASGESTPPPPAGFSPDTSTTGTASATTPNVPPAPAGFAPETPNVPNTPVSSALMGDDATPLDNFMTGAAHGAAQTADGALGLVEKLGNPSGDPNNERPWFRNARQYLRANETNDGTGSAGLEEGLGNGAETVAEFLLGDEVLKGLSVSARLAKTGKLVEAIETSPRLNRLVQAGMRALRSGTVGAVQGDLKSDGNTEDAVLSGLAAGSGSAILPELPTIVRKDLPSAFSLKNVKEALEIANAQLQHETAAATQSATNAFHSSLRSILDDVAQDADVQPTPSSSLRDTAANVSQAVKAKASGLYRQLDEAVGGTRFQTWDEQINKVQRALRQDVGIDPDYTGKLIEHLNGLEDAKAAALETAKANGVDPKLIDQANSLWRQGSALEDLSKHVQASTSGLRPVLAQGGNAAQEAVSPAKLAIRANRLYDSGRLQQALGGNRADDLLKATEQAKQRLSDIAQDAVKRSEAAKASAADRADVVRRNRMVAASTAGAVGVGGAWHWLSHLLGE